MTDDQKWQVQTGIAYATKKMQQIETETNDLYEQCREMDTQLLLLLDDVVEALPKVLRAQAKACLEKRNQARKARLAEVDSTLAAWQKETSPVCLAASDSF